MTASVWSPRHSSVTFWGLLKNTVENACSSSSRMPCRKVPGPSRIVTRTLTNAKCITLRICASQNSTESSFKVTRKSCCKGVQRGQKQMHSKIFYLCNTFWWPWSFQIAAHEVVQIRQNICCFLGSEQYSTMKRKYKADIHKGLNFHQRIHNRVVMRIGNKIDGNQNFVEGCQQSQWCNYCLKT